ncbi:MAG TPA: outer membrane beta-barrel protein [Candidatus Polarisedimenticolia bacterium]|nr:outer membrane beta-barrel protein [Candidatus Polarisedimenticolia bacterium]
MTRSLARRALPVLGIFAVAVFSGTGAMAEDLKGRWYFGGNLSFLSTTDDIRSNASIIIGPLGDDGIPFTGDMNEEQGCTSASANTFCDPRPDDLLARETAIEETFKIDGTVGYGMTSWLSLQFDVSYFKGDVGPVDVFYRSTFPQAGITGLNVTVGNRDNVVPVQAGEITEIPVSLSGIIRFRKDSPLNPYVGVGAGMIFAQMDVSEDVFAANRRFGAMRIIGATNEFSDDITPPSQGALKADGRVPFQWPITVNVDDAFEWHLTGGAEYFINDRFSMVFDARYTFADQSIEINLAGENQVDIATFPEELFRADGSVKYFRGPATGAPNTLCSDAFVEGDPNTTADDKFGVGCNASSGPSARVTCNPGPSPDLDNSGVVPMDPDVCYNTVIFNGARSPAPRGDVVVQGGRIDLTGFSVAVGLRVHF